MMELIDTQSMYPLSSLTTSHETIQMYIQNDLDINSTVIDFMRYGIKEEGKFCMFVNKDYIRLNTSRYDLNIARLKNIDWIACLKYIIVGNRIDKLYVISPIRHFLNSIGLDISKHYIIEGVNRTY